jgi:hypothetical protein
MSLCLGTAHDLQRHVMRLMKHSLSWQMTAQTPVEHSAEPILHD